MIGTSLPFDFLTGQNNIYGNADSFLEELKKHGVASVEIRSVRAKADPKDVLKAANLLISHGFAITIHSSVKSEETAVNDIFRPLSEVFAILKQPELTVTIHPINGDNAAMLTSLSDYIRVNNLPVRIALENNRLMPDKSRGDCVAFATDIVSRVDRDEIGICFDMGHFCWYTDGETVPPREFAKKVIHTHIHALSDGKTHFPLDCALPLKEYISSLPHSYYGVYNIELDPLRFIDSREPKDALVKSVDILSSALPFYTGIYDKIRTGFTENMKKSFDAVEKAETDTFALVQSTSYLLRYAGVKFAMDFALRDALFLTDAGKHIPSLFSGYSFHILTHNHSDHFDYNTVVLMKDLPIKWILPHFMTEQALRYGIPKENIIVAEAGKEIQIENIRILPFESRHYRPGTNNGVDELGYCISSEDSPTMLFPGDIRDYSTEGLPEVPDPDWLFAHIWLSDSNEYLDVCREYAEQQAAYISSFRPKNVVFSHLYESGRKDHQMWKKEHAELVAEGINDIPYFIPEPGTPVKLK